MNSRLKEDIKEKALELGFLQCGITDARPFTQFERKLAERMERFPHARSLYAGLKEHSDPRLHLPGAQAIIACINHYGRYTLPDEIDRYIGRNYLFDGRLEESEAYRRNRAFSLFLKTCGISFIRGKIAERWAAVRAGIAGFGRNNFIYTDRGSWVNVETWIVDVELNPDPPVEKVDCPEDCRLCIEACPTDALQGPFSMDWSKCIAHLTYRGPQPTPDHLREPMGSWLYGCDLCQTVCPLNRGQWSEKGEFPGLNEISPYLYPRAILEIDEKTFKEMIYPRFWYAEELLRWQINALRALGNSGECGNRPLLERFKKSPENDLKIMATWALSQLSS